MAVTQEITAIYRHNTGRDAMPRASYALKKMSETTNGLSRLAEITKSARGDRSLREFGRLIGVSHATIDRLEGAYSEPSDATLEALAEATPYTYVELKAISMGIEGETTREFVSAEDVLKIAKELAREEQTRLMHMLLDL